MHHGIGHIVGVPPGHTHPLDTPPLVAITGDMFKLAHFRTYPLPQERHLAMATETETRIARIVSKRAVCILLEYFLVTVRNKVAKVMFLHVCVCPQRGVPGQVPPKDQVHPPPGTRYTPLGPGTPPPWDQVHLPGPGTPPQDQVHPPGLGTPPSRPGTPPETRYTPQDQVHPPGTKYTPRTRYIPRDQVHPPPPADGYCCGRYASYWNAFLCCQINLHHACFIWFRRWLYFMFMV